jgi:hypothetical protein
MDPKQQEISERDQLWASLRSLREEIEHLAKGDFEGTDRERQVIAILARIMVTEIDFRQRYAESE